MNTTLRTDDGLLVNAMLTIAIKSADNVMMMISLRKIDGQYVCDIAHPANQEPPIANR